MSIDAGFRDWLLSEALWTSAAALAAPWAALAGQADSISPFADKAGADSEAARQRALRVTPIVRDRHIVAGLRSDLIGRLVTLTGPRFGYDAGVKCLVIAARETEGNTTDLSVLRRL